MYAVANPELVDKLVLANRIVYDQGVVDGMGHVSVRHDAMADTFLLSVNRAPGLVRRSDIISYNLDGHALTDDAPRPYLERFIHAEIYRARPDVIAVVHSHSPHVIPFSITGATLRPTFHMAGFLGAGAGLFDIRREAGDTDMLVRDAYLGKALARSLAAHSCVLMRGHGSTVVGASLEQVVYRAVYLEVNARIQLQATALGEIAFLNEREAQLAAACNDGQLARPWQLWVDRLGDLDLDA